MYVATLELPVGVKPLETLHVYPAVGPVIVHEGVPAPFVGVTPPLGPVTFAVNVMSDPSVVGLVLP